MTPAAPGTGEDGRRPVRTGRGGAGRSAVAAEPTLAIDFGTCFSSAALVTEGAVKLVKEPATSLWSWPSSVCLDGDQLLIGSIAEHALRVQPTNVVGEFKRFLGQAAPINLGGRSFATDALATAVILGLKEEAERLAGSRLKRAVLTVPASVTVSDPRFDLMLDVGYRAGFADVELLAEPVAAALAPVSGAGGLVELPAGATVLIYDFGGGTFDAALIRLGGTVERNVGQHTVLGHAALDDCGGRDIDAALVDHIRSVLDPPGDRRQAAVGEDPASARLRRARFQVELAGLARRLKHQLSGTAVAREFLTSADAVVSVDRTVLGRLAAPLVDRTISCCRALIHDVGVDPEDLHAVLLVGGSTRMPLVADAVRRLGVRLLWTEDPDLAVAHGAGRFAALAHTRQSPATRPRPGVHPLAWDVPGGSATVHRWLVMPGEHVRAGDALVRIRLSDGTLHDLTTAEPGQLLRHQGGPGDVVLSGDWLASMRAATSDDESEPAGQPAPVRLRRFTGFTGAAFGPDRRILVTVGADRIAVWSLATALPIASHDQATVGVWSMFAAGQTSGETGHQSAPSSQDGPRARPSVTVDATGDCLVWVDGAGKANLLDARTCRPVPNPTPGVRLGGSPPGSAGRPRRLLPAMQEDLVRTARFSPVDDRLLAVASAAGSAQMWNVFTGEELAEVAPGELVQDLVFSGDGRLLATSGDQGLRIWDTGTGALVWQVRDVSQPGAMAFGALLAIAGHDSPEVRLLDVDRRVEVARLAHHGPVTGLAFAVSAGTLAVACQREVVWAWDLTTISDSAPLNAEHHACRVEPEHTVDTLSISTDGSLLAATGTAAGDSRRGLASVHRDPAGPVTTVWLLTLDWL